jgi:ubiquitin carboxyl-terminal hydrolase L3
MNKLAHRLGLSPNLVFHDLYSLTEPSLLAMIPRPVHALLYLYPTTEASEHYFSEEQAAQCEYTGSGPDEPVLFYKQTIGHACGTIGLLHCITNGTASQHITPNSDLDTLVKATIPLKLRERADVLYNSEALEAAHKEAAQTGDSRAPTTDEHVGYGFSAFVKGKDGHLYELEGRRKGPVDRGVLAEDEDILSPRALELGPLMLINREKAGEGRFSVIALTDADADA